MEEKVYLNGWTGTFEEARVSVNDRGFVFGDGVYEVIRVYGGKMFALEEHMERLENSAAAVDMPLPRAREGLKAICREVLKESGIKEAMVYVQVTRGTEPRNHFFDPELKPNLLVTVRQVPNIPACIYNGGIRVITWPDIRWEMCHVKSISLQANVLAKHRARQAGAKEVIFVTGVGTVTECGSSNIFIYSKGALFTHPADNKILPGITRKHVLEIARSAGLEVKEVPFDRSCLMNAEEVFCTNTVEEIMPVTVVDGNIMGGGRPGPVTDRLHKEFTSYRYSATGN